MAREHLSQRNVVDNDLDFATPRRIGVTPVVQREHVISNGHHNHDALSASADRQLCAPPAWARDRKGNTFRCNVTLLMADKRGRPVLWFKNDKEQIYWSIIRSQDYRRTCRSVIHHDLHGHCSLLRSALEESFVAAVVEVLRERTARAAVLDATSCKLVERVAVQPIGTSTVVVARFEDDPEELLAPLREPLSDSESPATPSRGALCEPLTRFRASGHSVRHTRQIARSRFMWRTRNGRSVPLSRDVEGLLHVEGLASRSFLGD